MVTRGGGERGGCSGQVQSTQLGNVPFSLVNPDKEYILQRNDGPAEKLHAFLSSGAATGVARHKAFTGVPKQLTPPSPPPEFVPSDKCMAAMLRFTLGAADLQPVWHLKVNKNKQAVPGGVGIVSRKQLIMPAQGRLSLQ